MILTRFSEDTAYLGAATAALDATFLTTFNLGACLAARLTMLRRAMMVLKHRFESYKV